MNRLLALALACVSFTGFAQWTCGDTWTYQGYDYETVQIGDQCWFAENLRSDQYANGDVIPSNVPDSALWTTQGAQTFFNLDSTRLDERGRLYNALAVTDQRGLCPTDWHVPTDDEFMDLELFIGMSEGEVSMTGENRGCEEGVAALIKSDTDWGGEGAGTNETGLGLKWTGYHFYPDNVDGFGNYGQGHYWTSSLRYPATSNSPAYYWSRNLQGWNNCIWRGHDDLAVGRAVRCMRTVDSDSNEDSGGTDSDIQGCTDPDALNFNPEATADDESCTYAPEVATGDWTHQGHAYETVLIGDQCWFAENLRSEQYANGDDLLHAGPDPLWADANQTSSGAWCHPNGEPENSVAYGHLYNHWVALDERGVCPIGWNVPTDGDYIQLEMHAGMPLEVALEEDVRGTDEGLKLKAAEGQFEGWQGTDAYGFSWVPGGWRHVGGSYGGTHALGLHLFTPSEESNGAPYGFRQVDGTQTQVGRYFVGNMGDGRSIRCLLASSCSADNDIQGCTDPDALNFNPEATADDASCTYAPDVPECASVCGPGTYWDMEQALCLPTLSADLDLSGCVGMSDLLEMLAQFGTCYVPEWSCGDDLNYQGYDYQTVMVAGDCWFAENLKSENYRNGDPIPTLDGEEAWFYTEEGAQGFYANGQVPCIHFCNPAVAEDLFGRVYNWFAVDDNRGLCPSGWHVSEVNDWENLFSYVEGQVGDSVSFALKATSTWYEIDGIPGVGTDDFGMSIMPTGQRAVKLHGNGNLALDANAGYQGSYWTSDSHSAEFGRDVYFHHWYLDPNISNREKEYAVSVRCVLD